MERPVRSRPTGGGTEAFCGAQRRRRRDKYGSVTDTGGPQPRAVVGAYKRVWGRDPNSSLPPGQLRPDLSLPASPLGTRGQPSHLRGSKPPRVTGVGYDSPGEVARAVLQPFVWRLPFVIPKGQSPVGIQRSRAERVPRGEDVDSIATQNRSYLQVCRRRVAPLISGRSNSMSAPSSFASVTGVHRLGLLPGSPGHLQREVGTLCPPKKGSAWRWRHGRSGTMPQFGTALRIDIGAKKLRTPIFIC